VLFIEPSEWGFLPLRMGAGQAAAGRPLGATVEVRLQRHGASGRGTVSKRHCSNSFFFLLLLLLLYIFFYLWGPKNELQQGRCCRIVFFTFEFNYIIIYIKLCRCVE